MLQLLKCTALQSAHSNAYQVLRQVQHSHRSQQGFPLGVEGPMQHAISQATSCRPPCIVLAWQDHGAVHGCKRPSQVLQQHMGQAGHAQHECKAEHVMHRTQMRQQSL